MARQPSIAVIVLVWNGADYLDACLTALLSQKYDPLRVIVVDNDSTDRSVEIARRYLPRIRLVQTGYNYGFAGGINAGLAETDAEIVVLLNQDTEVQPGWLQAVAATYADHADMGIVGCKLYYPRSRTLQHAGGWVRRPDAFSYHIGQDEEDSGQYDTLLDAEYVTGAAFAIHRRVLNVLGGLDDRYFPAFYEEIDYCYRARRSGFRVVYQPQAVVYHHETTSLPIQSYRRVLAFHRNRIRFVLRNWDMPDLNAFVLAEREATAATLWLEDVAARARAYWLNLANLPEIAQARRAADNLAGPLADGDLRRLIDALEGLRSQAQDRVVALVEADLDPVADPPAPPTPAKPMVPGWEIEQNPLWVTTDATREVHRMLDRIAAAQTLREHEFHSDLPLIGGLVARLRSMALSVATRWYVRPVLHQQSQLNATILQALALLHQMSAALAQAQQAEAARSRRAEQHQALLLERQARQIEAVRTLLAGDDMALAEAVRHALDGRQSLSSSHSRTPDVADR
jgi:GT2 family glycosyltransferase